MPRIISSWECALALAATIVLGSSAARCEPATELGATISFPEGRATPAAQLTANDLEAFFGGFMPAQLARSDIAGAAVIVVKDGTVVFGRGYGYADVSHKLPVVLDQTIFRVGSVSKLFVWTAVMQMVEAGKLDLDRDVNEYLDFKIEKKFAAPVTLRALMTHTGGFEETFKDLFVGNVQSIVPLRDYLKAHVPARLFAPGTVPAYSNYGTVLSAYIVERASGERFADYVRAHIFSPLGMDHSTFEQPLPVAFKERLSQGYSRASAPPRSMEIVQAAPAGALSTTAMDMAQFAIAHLQDGRFGQTQILRRESAQTMHATAFSIDPRVPGMCLGFMDESRNGHRIIGHGGDTQYFHSYLYLMLDANTGLFVSTNSSGNSPIDLRTLLWERFLDRYFPAAREPPSVVSGGANDNARRVPGSYMLSRHSDSNFLRILAILGESRFTSFTGATIVGGLIPTLAGQPKRWQEIAPLVYQEIDGQQRIAFRQDRSGSLIGSSEIPAIAYEKIGFSDSKSLNLLVSVIVIGIATLTILLWPVGALVRRHYGRKLSLSRADRRLRITARIVCAWIVTVLAGWALWLAYALGDIARFSSSMDPLVYSLELASILGGIGLIPVGANVYASWRRSPPWWSKGHDALIFVMCIGFVWLGVVFRLFQLTAHY